MNAAAGDERAAEELARQVRARATEAPLADDIRTLADRAIDQINALADEAMAKAVQVDVLVQRLAALLEADDGRP